MLSVQSLATILTLTALTGALPSPAAEPVRSEIDLLKTGPCEWVKDDSAATSEIYKHMQVTAPQDCGTNFQCETGQSKAHTWGYEVSGGGNNAFASAGFAVSETWTNEQTHTCNGQAGQTICTWMKVKYLEYGVKPKGYCSLDIKPKTIRAPVTGQGKDQTYYCVAGTCRQDADWYWGGV